MIVKNNVYKILVCCMIILGTIGCGNSKMRISEEELEKVNSTIVEYFQTKGSKIMKTIALIM